MILLGISIYVCINQMKKIEIYEGWIAHFRSEIEVVYNRIKAVDERNLFEKDDDVGETFSSILNIIKEFDETIK